MLGGALSRPGLQVARWKVRSHLRYDVDALHSLISDLRQLSGDSLSTGDCIEHIIHFKVVQIVIVWSLVSQHLGHDDAQAERERERGLESSPQVSHATGDCSPVHVSLDGASSHVVQMGHSSTQDLGSSVEQRTGGGAHVIQIHCILLFIKNSPSDCSYICTV